MSKPYTNPCSPHRLFAGLLGLLLAVPAWTLPEDREQPIQIESDRAERQERTGLTIYEGDVVITQGTIRVEADKVTVHMRDSQVVRIEAVGNPARYHQIVEQDGEPVRASSLLIDYNVQQEQITLSRDARLEQQGSTITGEHIEYDLIQEIIRAQGDLEGRQRIRMVIPPGTQQRNEGENGSGNDAAVETTDTATDGEATTDVPADTTNGN